MLFTIPIYIHRSAPAICQHTVVDFVKGLYVGFLGRVIAGDKDIIAPALPLDEQHVLEYLLINVLFSKRLLYRSGDDILPIFQGHLIDLSPVRKPKAVHVPPNPATSL
ncbi:hypothetical protein GCM10011339_19520 [Echinicola rosea]|uniref:Uncharacterized protein n=1 Tax=Echinicola rosea TaxID=1807691 RepID=A0ABQ1UZC1_9BACT|nr:hypothetical protein GCM10011339_19520 [Echinicola rosea]